MNANSNISSDQFSLERINFDLDAFKEKTYLTHNFFSYPAKFIPQFPREIINTLSERGETVLDPFCGSGTTLVEAKLLGRNSIGVDINPIATLASKVKTTIITSSQIKDIRAVVEEIEVSVNLHYGIKQLVQSRSKCIDFSYPTIPNRDYWFKPMVLDELSIIKAHLNEVSDNQVRDFLTLAFISIITKVSNQESDTRFVSVSKSTKKLDTFKEFSKKIEQMVERIKEFEIMATSASARVYNKNANDLSFLDNDSIDLVVTSPPYLNAYDYYLYHKFRMWWLGLDHHLVQRDEIGSRNKHSDHNLEPSQYIASVKQCLQESIRPLKSNRFVVIVIGDAIKNRKLIKMDDCFKALGNDIGLTLKKEFTYPLRKYTRAFQHGNNGIQKDGYIMIFCKN